MDEFDELFSEFEKTKEEIDEKAEEIAKEDDIKLVDLPEKTEEEAGFTSSSSEEPEIEQEESEPEEIKVMEETEEEESKQPEIMELPVEEDAVDVFLIYGDKGHGKTVQALGFPGKVVAFSFDSKTARIKKRYYNNDKRITVYNVLRGIDFKDDVSIKETALKVYEAMIKTLENTEADAIVFDGAEMLQLICEWAVRMRSDLDTFAGMPFDKWKERKALMIKLHQTAEKAARKAIIYTCYPAKDDIVVEGEFTAKVDAPKWIDIIVTFTDFVLHAFRNPQTGRYMVKVVSSKDVDVVPEKLFDVHGKTIWEAIRWK